MCIYTLVLEKHEDYPFILFFNRDEEYDRPTLPLAVEEQGLVCARDGKAHGTWCGLNASRGIVAALTNVRNRLEPPSHCSIRSRGDLVLAALLSPSSSSSSLQGEGGEAAAEAGAGAAAPRQGEEEGTWYAYNLLTGSIDGSTARASLRFEANVPTSSSDNGPQEWRTTSSTAVVGPGIWVKSNESTGVLQGGVAVEEEDGEWPKVALVRRHVGRLFAKDATSPTPTPTTSSTTTATPASPPPSSAAWRGETAAREGLLPALADIMGRSLPHGDEACAGAAAAAVQRWSPLPLPLEEALHRGPFLRPLELHAASRRQEAAAPVPAESSPASSSASSSSSAPARLYGTVSQTAIITCVSERALFYAYRETKATTIPDAEDDASAPFSGGEWTWLRFPLPSPPPPMTAGGNPAMAAAATATASAVS